MAYFARGLRGFQQRGLLHACGALAVAGGVGVHDEGTAHAARERRIEEVYDLFDNKPIGMVSKNGRSKAKAHKVRPWH